MHLLRITIYKITFINEDNDIPNYFYYDPNNPIHRKIVDIAKQIKEEENDSKAKKESDSSEIAVIIYSH